MSEASLDFETRGGTDINLGLAAYVDDPEFEVLCAVFDAGDMLGRVLWRQGDPRPARLFNHVSSGGMVRAWNAPFEWEVWNHYLVPEHDWPPLPIEQCVCTMAEAQAMNLPASLGKCGAVLGLDADKQKSARGKALIQLLCVPQQEPVVKPLSAYRSKGAHTRAVNDHARWALIGRWNNDPALLAELHAYCDQDVVAEQAIKRKVRRLTGYERQVWLMTQRINQRGVPVDVGRVRCIHHVVEQEALRLNTELRVLTDGAVTAGSQVSPLRSWVNERLPPDYYLPDMTSETVEARLLLAEQPDHAPAVSPPVVRALRIRSQVGQTSTAKLPKMLQVVARDGTLKNMHVYHGASTGRDASRGGVNLQNLKSPIVADIDTALRTLGTGDHEAARLVWGDQLMDAAVSTVRGCIAAPDGMQFIDADYSSVENRVSAWIAGQTDKLDLFRQGLDEYKTLATKIFGVPYDQVTGAQRKFCKPAILGGMFGQGANGLVEYAAGIGVYLTQRQAQAHTDLYRAEYRKVRNLWYRCGDASIEAVETPEVWVQAGAKLKLCVFANFLWMELPSGRRIAWASPRVEERMAPWGEMRPCVTVEQTNSRTHQWRREDLIGSSIFQSGVQGTARDLLMGAVFRVEDAGYSVVLRVHDELLTCNPIGFGSPEQLGDVLCVGEAWCTDLPLASEGWAGREFRK